MMEVGSSYARLWDQSLIQETTITTTTKTEEKGHFHHILCVKNESLGGGEMRENDGGGKSN
jgi:hypothetical protein